MNKKILILSAILPFAVIGEATKEKVEKKREKLHNAIKIQATEIADYIDKKNSDLQGLIDVQQSLCFDNKNCIAAMEGFKAILHKNQTGIYAPKNPLLPAIDRAIRSNIDDITREAMIERPIGRDIRLLVVLKKVVEDDQDFLKFAATQLNQVVKSSNPSADLCDLLNQNSLEQIDLKMQNDLISKIGSEGNRSWNDMELQKRDKLVEDVFSLWLLNPEGYELGIEMLAHNPSLKESVIQAVDAKKELDSSLEQTDYFLRLIGVDPDEDAPNASLSEKGASRKKREEERAKKREEERAKRSTKKVQ